MISRVSVLLRGMGNAFDMRLRVSEAWRKHARALLKKTDPEYYLLKKEEAEETEEEESTKKERGKQQPQKSIFRWLGALRDLLR